MLLTPGERFFTYCRLRLKRNARLLPGVLCVSLLLLLAVALLALAAGSERAGDESRQKIAVGIVSDPADSFLQLGIRTLETMDRSRFALELVHTDEAEAADALRRGELDAYLVIPSGFIDALSRGETLPMRYVSGSVGLGGAVTDEIVRCVASLLLETENAVYGAQNYAAAELPDTDPYALGDRLALRYLAAILNREDLYVTETLGVGAGLDVFHYYLCALSVLFLLLWGILAAPLCAREGMDARRTLAASGLGALPQLAGEYLAYLPVMLICYGLALALAFLASALLPGLGALLPEAPARLLPYLLRALVPALVFAAMQLWFAELGGTGVGALLLQFLGAAAMAFVCGCFYPSSMLPAGMQSLGRVLPAGAALRFTAGTDPAALGLLALWLAAFLALCWLARRRGLRKG